MKPTSHKVTHLTKRIRRPDIWCHQFSRFLGRELTPVEKNVISRLERARRLSRPRPIVIVDPKGYDSTDLLRSYLDFRLATSPEGATALLYLSREGKQREFSGMYPEYTGYTRRQVKTLHKRIRYASYSRPDSVRGTSPAFMLLLNAQEYKGYSPMQPNPGKFLSLCSALFPLLCGIGFLVIHINVDREQIPAFFYLGMQGHTIQRPPKPEPPVETAILVLTDPTSILRWSLPTREGPQGHPADDAPIPRPPIPT